MGWIVFTAALAVSVTTRRRARANREAAIDVVWHHVFFSEQASATELEVGWLRMLVAAMRARRAFENRRGARCLQLIELAKWRPDLEPVVLEMAKSTVAIATAKYSARVSPMSRIQSLSSE